MMQAEENRRNSKLDDLLFISCSHTLAPFVFSFYDRYTHLIGKERHKVDEEIEPMARYDWSESLCLLWIGKCKGHILEYILLPLSCIRGCMLIHGNIHLRPRNALLWTWTNNSLLWYLQWRYEWVSSLMWWRCLSSHVHFTCWEHA
jgi:hypothetical protein